MLDTLPANPALIHIRIPKKQVREHVLQNGELGVLAALHRVRVGSVLGYQELGFGKSMDVVEYA